MLQPNTEKIDCVVRVVTPENVEFEYMVAGPFQRAMAFVFDFVVRIFIFVGLSTVLFFSTAFVPFSGALATVASILLYFVMSWFYGVYFESRFNGRTLGKMVFKLRVISTDGRPINGVQAALRNLLRLADYYPSPMTGLVSMTLTKRFQRIGDLAAGTMVIVDRTRQTPWDLQPDDPRAFGLAELIPPSYIPNYLMTQTIGMYMENRQKLPMSRRLEIAKHLADPLLVKFDMLRDTSPDLLLCAMYVRMFMSDKQLQDGRERLRQTAMFGGGAGPRAPRVGPAVPSTAQTLAPPSSSVQRNTATPQMNTPLNTPQLTSTPVAATQANTTAHPAASPSQHADGLLLDDDVVEVVAEVIEPNSPMNSTVKKHSELKEPN